jgi:uncharacterized protein (DUF362 family)
VSADSRTDSRVGAVRPRVDSYGEPGLLAELRQAVDGLASAMSWTGTDGSPFGALVGPSDRVLLKPNWVHDRNQGPWGLEPLVTHGSVIRTVAEGLLDSHAGEVLIGDAPLQLCDLARLLAETGVLAWAHDLQRRDSRFHAPRDFRRTKSVLRNGLRVAHEDQLPLERFVEFDLGTESLLEAITVPGRFRVTQYHPEPLSRTHSTGVHRYLVAREVLEATVIVNLPKLKTHKKAGMTCALKNLIGINGNKEYLPHHRIGGTAEGGDCYPDRDRVKRLLELAYDRVNSAGSAVERRMWDHGVRVLNRLLRSRGDVLGVEGGWSGNDTIWRTCLDLNRVVLYGRPDGSLAETPQRRVVHVVDALVAGQGDGPLASQPVWLGLLLGSQSAPAVDWVGARLLGFDPHKLPICRHAFDAFRWPIAHFLPADIILVGDLGAGPAEHALEHWASPVAHYPAGWLNARAAAEEAALSTEPR